MSPSMNKAGRAPSLRRRASEHDNEPVVCTLDRADARVAMTEPTRESMCISRNHSLNPTETACST